MSLIARIWRRVRRFAKSAVLVVNRLRFHVFFKNTPAEGEYCNSKRIHRVKEPADDRQNRPYLAVIRCGASHRVVDDGSERQFDIALSLYARPSEQLLAACEYAYSGGVNKYKAARQFIDGASLQKFRGFILLDDDVEITYAKLSQFLDYCWAHGFALAQPSLTSDSSYSHSHLLNTSRTGWRSVSMVEVMCPYFSSSALAAVLGTFDLSYSTWGLDYIWPRLLDVKPVVVDEFSIKHTRPVGGSDSAFYRYLRRIGVSPQQEGNALKNISIERLRSIAMR